MRTRLDIRLAQLRAELARKTLTLPSGVIVDRATGRMSYAPPLPPGVAGERAAAPAGATHYSDAFGDGRRRYFVSAPGSPLLYWCRGYLCHGYWVALSASPPLTPIGGAAG